MIASRVNPITVKPGTLTGGAKAHLVKPVQSISISIKIGATENVSIGYIQKFNWNVSRPTSEIYQIEPCVDGTFKSGISDLVGKDVSFYDSNYHPGEVIEVIPGKQGPVSLDISRAVLYGSNLMSALMYVESAGSESPDGAERSPLLFGGDLMQYVSLIQQVRPFYLKQLVYNPIDGKVIWGRVFQDVWIEDWSEEIPDASKNEVVVDTMKAKAARIRPYNAPQSKTTDATGAVGEPA